MSENELDLARLVRALQVHARKVYHEEAYDQTGLVRTCWAYCAPDIARRYADPNLMELDDDESAAEDATW